MKHVINIWATIGFLLGVLFIVALTMDIPGAGINNVLDFIIKPFLDVNLIDLFIYGFGVCCVKDIIYNRINHKE